MTDIANGSSYDDYLNPVGRPAGFVVCTVCGEPIPAARLRAVPNATTCVACLEAQGDVTRLRSTGDGDVVEQTFIRNQYAARQLRRMNKSWIRNAVLRQVFGQQPDDVKALIGAEPLYTAFEDDVITQIDAQRGLRCLTQ